MQLPIAVVRDLVHRANCSGDGVRRLAHQDPLRTRLLSRPLTRLGTGSIQSRRGQCGSRRSRQVFRRLVGQIGKISEICNDEDDLDVIVEFRGDPNSYAFWRDELIAVAPPAEHQPAGSAPPGGEDFWLDVGIDPIRIITSIRRLPDAAVLPRRCADIPWIQQNHQCLPLGGERSAVIWPVTPTTTCPR